MKLKLLVFAVCIVFSGCSKYIERENTIITPTYKISLENDISNQTVLPEKELIETELLWKTAYMDLFFCMPEMLEDPYGLKTQKNYSDSERWLYLGTCDFDEDCIPELIIGDSYSLGVFTYENNQTIKIADLFMQEHWFSVNGVYLGENSILLESNGSDGSGFVGLTYKDGEYIIGEYCQYHPEKTLINSREVTYEEFCETFLLITLNEREKSSYSLEQTHFVKEVDSWFALTKEGKRTLEYLFAHMFSK